MQSIEQTKQIINNEIPKETPAGIGNRTIKENINKYDEKLILRISEPEYLKGYNASGYYYKAYTKQYLRENTEPILKEFNLNIDIFTSYNTDVMIYDYLNNIIIYNLDYYNSSKTTKNQVEFKINSSYYKFREHEYYLKENLFNELTSAIIQGQANKYYNMLDELIRRAERETAGLQYIEETIKKGTYLINNQQNKPETIKELKTRNRHHEEFNIYNIPVIQEYSTNKKNTRIITKVKIKINLDKQQLYTKDIRKYNEKILFNGYDMGVSNTKELKRTLAPQYY